MRVVEYQLTARPLRYAAWYAATLASSILRALSRYFRSPVKRHASAHSAAWGPHSFTLGIGVAAVVLCVPLAVFTSRNTTGSKPEQTGSAG